MAGKNREVCHSCRHKGHFFADCPKKRSCSWCKHTFVKCFEVEKDTKNKGKLFNCCNAKCGFWEWVTMGETSGEASFVSVASTTHIATDELSSMFETKCRFTDEHVTEISVNMTLHKGRTSVEELEKGKGLA